MQAIFCELNHILEIKLSFKFIEGKFVDEIMRENR